MRGVVSITSDIKLTQCINGELAVIHNSLMGFTLLNNTQGRKKSEEEEEEEEEEGEWLMAA